MFLGCKYDEDFAAMKRQVDALSLIVIAMTQIDPRIGEMPLCKLAVELLTGKVGAEDMRAKLTAMHPEIVEALDSIRSQPGPTT